MTAKRRTQEQDLVLLITHLHRAYRRAVNRVLATHGISESQALPVRFIAYLGDGVRQGVLADYVGVEGPSLVRQLDQLCAAGLVMRREDPTDRRGRTLHLTDQGHALAVEVDAMFRDLRRKFLAPISDADLAATLRALTLFDDALAQAGILAGPP